MKAIISIGVLVLQYNDATVVRDKHDSLVASYPRLHVWSVANAFDHSFGVEGSCARILWRKDNAGYGIALNELACLALSEAHLDVLVFMTHDVEMEEGEILRLAQRAYDLRGICGPRLLDRTSGLTSFGKQEDKTLYKESDPPDSLDGACLAIDSAAWATLGGFSERFFLYYEDLEFCHRARRHGIPVTVDAMTYASQKGGLISRGSVGAFLMARNRVLWLWATDRGRLSVWLMTAKASILQVASTSSRIGSGRISVSTGLREIVAIAQGTFDGLCGRGGPPRHWTISDSDVKLP